MIDKIIEDGKLLNLKCLKPNDECNTRKQKCYT